MFPISTFHALVGFTLAAAIESTAISAPAPRQVGALIIAGSITEGGIPSRFTQRIDLARASTKLVKQMGNSESQSGFDGEPWEEANDIVVVSNLPSAVAERRAEAWLDSQAWRQRSSGRQQSRRIIPSGSHPITLTFDPSSGRLRQAVIDGDWGPVVFSYSDWRPVGRFIYPFRREQVTPVGEHTIIQVETARAVAALPKASLARPLARSHAQLAGGAPATIPFIATGRKSSHILVDAMINDQPAKLIFDTGAANYLTSDSAPRFGARPTGGINLSGVGEGSTTGGYATLDRIALGKAALRNETVVVGPSPFPPSNGKPSEVAGFTGFEFLAEYVTTIDYPAATLTFAKTLPKNRRAFRVPFYNDGFHMYVPATIDGVTGLFGLDTGDGGTVAIFPAFASRFAIRGASGPVGSDGGGIGGAVQEQPGVLGRFSLGGLRFDRLPVRFSRNKTGAFASRSIAGNLGGGVLQCFRITIDFPHHLLLFDPAPEFPRCAPGGTVRRAAYRSDVHRQRH